MQQEGGFGLIEVVISSFILVLVTIGTLALFDEAQKTSAENRGRSASATLAEQDMENLRSTAAVTLGGDPATGRSGFTRTQTQTVDGISYTITSTAAWVRDATGAIPSCTDADGIAEYLQLTSTVDDTTGANVRVKPYTMTSLLSPRYGSFGRHTGTMTVELRNSRIPSGPVTNVPVAATGGQNATVPTNAAGCAIFSYFPSGNYSAAWSAAGYVDPNGDDTPTAAITVSDANTTRKTAFFDDAATITANIKTKAGANAVAPVVTFVNTGMTAYPSGRPFPATTVTTSTPYLGQFNTGKTMYPFVSGYAAYTGNCAANQPGGYSGQTTATIPTLVGGGSYTVVLSQPPISITAFTTSGSSTTVKNLTNAVFTPTDSGCTLKYKVTTPGTGGVVGSIPYGSYTVCVDDGSKKVSPSTVYANTALNTGISANLSFNSATSGVCT